ncbi:unnamed protein product [Schistosoma margrebowiei]|uniref:Uncharacterized protein n=1 Tax=Schistosoma margrebowiei TaxID=48269 RepID=A0A183LUC7_9TREM|nr:unnamed protein product [Schistosoma margrebowiei]
MKSSTSQEKYGIQLTARNQLENSDFVDDLALLSHIHQQMQVKADSLAASSTYTKEKARSPNATRKTPNNSHLMEKLWKNWNLSCTWKA